LYGILHAILLLLAGRVASAQHPRNPLVGNEMLFLIFSRCPRYTELYDLLIDSLEVFAAQDLPVSFNANGTVKPRDSDLKGKGTSSGVAVEIEAMDSGEGSKDKGESEDGDGEDHERLWMGPAVLILDAMCQSLLVDKSVLKVCPCSSQSHLVYLCVPALVGDVMRRYQRCLHLISVQGPLHPYLHLNLHFLRKFLLIYLPVFLFVFLSV
jgi:hypothetical protein